MAKESIEKNDRNLSIGVIEGFKFGFGFFLAMLLGWFIIIILAVLISFVARTLGLSI
jgi:hypothetical protein